jgi:peptide/nickel transport system ATP-binding protein
LTESTDPVVRLIVDNLQVNLAGQDVDVVSEVSFSVAKGEVLGLVGESGSGKTTVAHAILGYARRGLQVVAGAVRLDGRDLLTLPPAELRKVRGASVAYVPQDPGSALNPVLRVGTQVREILTAHPGTVANVDDRVREVLAEVKLEATPDMLRRYPHQLSGGQQQRVALATAFALRPSLLVLDEPTTGLDVTTQRHVLETVRDLCATYGVAGVYVSHDLAVVRELAQSVGVMYAGRLVEFGPTDVIFEAPAHPYTARLLRAIPSVERSHVLEGIPGQPPRPGQRPVGCSFAARCPLVIDVCRQGPPPVVSVGQRVHLSRCVKATEAILPAQQAVVSGGRPAAAEAGRGLVVRDLRASYGDTEVLHGLDFQVAEQSCLAIVGESGSGKTTLARCLVGMHPKWQGEITFGEERLPPGVQARPPETRRAIQYVFQNPYTSLNPRKTVEQLVEQPLGYFFDLPRSESRDRVVKGLADVALSTAFLRRYPDQLSGGERQRVAIARALVVEPDLLICDEVTSALDVSVQAVVIELLRDLQVRRKLMLVFITHNLSLVRAIGHQVVVMSEGRVVEAGPTDGVLDRPKHEYTVRLVQDIPKIGAASGV